MRSLQYARQCGEWAGDYYGDFNVDGQTDPTGAETGTLRMYQGGRNDLVKNMRSAYRAAMAENRGTGFYRTVPFFNIFPVYCFTLLCLLTHPQLTHFGVDCNRTDEIFLYT